MVKIQVNSQGKAYYTSVGKVLLAPEGGSSGKYSLLERISDDSNNEIGTVSGFFTDANNVEYAIVCLDAQYRLDSGQWSSSTGVVTNLPYYQNPTVWSSTETATFNTQKILDWCDTNSYTSSACSHCRSKSFTIDDTLYYGQLPNIVELVDIFRRRIAINSADTSASSYSSLIIPTENSCWSSTQAFDYISFIIASAGEATVFYKDTDCFVIPVLEIPNN